MKKRNIQSKVSEKFESKRKNLLPRFINTAVGAGFKASHTSIEI